MRNSMLRFLVPPWIGSILPGRCANLSQSAPERAPGSLEGLGALYKSLACPCVIRQRVRPRSNSASSRSFAGTLDTFQLLRQKLPALKNWPWLPKVTDWWSRAQRRHHCPLNPEVITKQGVVKFSVAWRQAPLSEGHFVSTCERQTQFGIGFSSDRKTSALVSFSSCLILSRPSRSRRS